jgi:hypothetical protein
VARHPRSLKAIETREAKAKSRGIEAKGAEKTEKSVSEIISAHAVEISKVPRNDQVKIIRAVMEKLHIGIRDFADGHIELRK